MYGTARAAQYGYSLPPGSHLSNHASPAGAGRDGRADQWVPKYP